MFFSNRINEKFRLRNILAIFILIIIGILGNHYRVSFSLGYDLFFGNIAAFIAVYLFGIPCGTFICILINSHTYRIWNHPYAIIIFTCEVIFLGIISKRMNKNIVLIDTIFWLLIGAPLLWIFYHIFLAMDTSQTLAIMLKGTINGILNALIADLIIIYIPISKWVFGAPEKTIVPINRSLYSLLLIFILLPILGLSIFDSYRDYRNIIDDTKEEMESRSRKIITTVDIWAKQHENAIEILGQYAISCSMVSCDKLQDRIKLMQQAAQDIESVYVVNKAGTIVEFYSKTDNKDQSVIGQNFSDRSYYKMVKSTLKPVISDIFEGDSLPIVTINVPIIKNGQFEGCVSAAIDITYISFMLRSEFYNENWLATIIDSNKNIIASNNYNFEPMKCLNYGTYDEILVENDKFYLRMSNDKNLSNIKRWEQAYYICQSKFEGNMPWQLVVEKPFATIQKSFQEYYIKNLATLLILTLVALILTIILVNFLANPTLKLAGLTIHLPGKLVEYDSILGKNNYQSYLQLQKTMTLDEDELNLGNHLRKALEEGQLELYYQPKFNLNTGKIVGAEALIRWNHPELGIISPADFIPTAEKTGLIIPIGEWVIREACRQNKSWQDKGYPPIRVSINISVLQLEHRNFLGNFQNILNDIGISGKWIDLEITESIIIKNIDFIMEIIKKVKQMGISVSLDDFGVGFSSLNYLKDLKIDTIKIDSSFIRDMKQDNESAAIVATIISLAKELSINVVAEGVETQEQCSFLQQHQCDEIQGYLISKPIPAEEFIHLISMCE